ncbi:thiamin biosynthesis protein, putative [Prunus dulcis]|uniref:thiamine phosphate synthase n=1 Tax=Prunus dulcis TaxID=3755 RepID=A0A4Y1QWB1_PRUDU|nr:thiamin biosynthesis protein, putative [Prunus dulcis]
MFLCRKDSGNRRGNGSPTTSNQSTINIPHVLTVAGSDSGAGAGIQADLKACAARGVYCSTVITAITAQNTVGVQGVNVVPEDFVAEQMKSVLSDMHVDVSRFFINILGSILFEAALVVDPVMVSTSGDVLAGPSVLAGFREELLPMANIITPNLKEASALLDGVKIKTVSDMRSAAKLLHDKGARISNTLHWGGGALFLGFERGEQSEETVTVNGVGSPMSYALSFRNVLVKGGDLPDSLDAVDIFFDGEHLYELRSSRIKTRNTHGTGCTLASCIAAELAKGASMLEAVKVAKCFVETALDYSKEIFIGNGPQGPFDHLMKLKSNTHNSGMNRRWGHSISDAVKAAVQGGATIVQLREKDIETRDFVEAAKSCLQICRAHGVPLLINDRIDVALACDADGVHIGQSDMPAHTARALLGPEKIIGVSCKTPEQAEQAWIAGADYIGCGGVYPTNTKANNLTVGLDGLKTVCLASKLPVVAIGGIKVSNARPVMEIGVPNLKGVAVVSAIFDSECVLTETRKLHAVLTEATAAVK